MGLPWLVKVHGAFLTDQPIKTTGEDFSHILDECVLMEQTLRAGGYAGCIFGDNSHCPEDAVITCDACAEVAK